MSYRKKILCMGWYGAGNIGDELILDMLRRWADEANASLTVLSFDTAHTSRLHHLPAIYPYDLEAVVQAVQDCDLFVLGGGGLLQTHQPYSLAGLYSFESSDISCYLRPVLLAKQLGKPVLVWAQGIGPLDTEQSQEITRQVFSLADGLSVRDEQSKQLLEKCGIEKLIHVAPDPVWAWPLPKPIDSSSSIRIQEKFPKKRIGIMARSWSYSVHWKERFVNALRETIPSEENDLIWLDLVIDPAAPETKRDTDIAELMQALATEYHQELIFCKDFQRCIEDIDSCDALISMRLHGGILAAKLQKPLVLIAYDPKVQLSASQMQMPTSACIAIDAEASVWEKAFADLMERPFVIQSDVLHELSVSAQSHAKSLTAALGLVIESKNNLNGFALSRIDWMTTWITNTAYKHSLKEKAVLEDKIAWLDANYQKQKQLAVDWQEKSLQSENQLALANQSWKYSDRELQKTKNSLSWKLTHPLRFANLFLKSPKQALMQETRRIYRRLPGGLQTALRPVKTMVRRWLSQSAMPSHAKSQLRSSSDMSWAEFAATVLKKRSEFKGIFIQEIVIDWFCPLYQRPQHMACAFGKLGYLVIYRTANLTYDRVFGVRQVADNVWLTDSHAVDEVQDAVISLYSTAYSMPLQAIELKKKQQYVVYEYIDHIDPQISGGSENIENLKKLQGYAFHGGADYVVASAKKLYEEAVSAVGSSKVILVPNGVDTVHYRDEAHKSLVLPTNLKKFREKYKTVVGYFGALAPWLWYDIITELTQARSDVGFLFIGPDYYNGAASLPQLPNVLNLGAVDYRILPGYAATFDVCFIPFAPGEIARTTSPLKLFEYFALEKPVVVTSDMVECTCYSEVFSGYSADTLSSAIDAAISMKSDIKFKARLRDLADANSWHQRALAYETIFTKTSDNSAL
jgi:polysaccharide pyruvyl transferase CsaB